MYLIVSLFQSVVAFLFGAGITVLISGAREARRWKLYFGIICSVLLAAQLLCVSLLGLDATRKLYPFIVHFPLWALLVILCKTEKLQTAVSMLMAYMCCQSPRWIASLGYLLPEDHVLYCILYFPAAGMVLFLVNRYFTGPIRGFMERSRRSCLIMGLIPGLYYMFDYVTSVYTGLLWSGNPAAVQFMPSVISVAYLMFIVFYHNEQERQAMLERQRDYLALQLHNTKQAISAMQQLQEKTRQYRHDMRHHFSLLQTMVSEKNLPKLEQYLATAQQDVEDLTPIRHCGNEVVNLLLSYFDTVARKKQVSFRITGAMPQTLSCSDTELCSLLSNGLENAIEAASKAPSDRRCVLVSLGMYRDNLLIQIENTFVGSIRWKDGLPCTDRQEHGLGTRSIRAIVRACGGEAIFREQGEWFQLRILIPGENSGKRLENL